MNMTLPEIAMVMDAMEHDPALNRYADARPSAVRTDSRAVGEGDLFFCIKGERFDGHDYASQALEAGALAVVAHRPLELSEAAKATGRPVIMVRNTVNALGALARRHRDTAGASVVGVTGSAGKTTVKELLAGLLAKQGRTAKNPLNHNNQIGLPLSMLEADGGESFWVMEVGISLPRDMDELGEILAPDLALIVNVGPAHTQGLGGIAGVAAHKARLMAHCKEGGEVVLSADYPELLDAAMAHEPPRILFSTSEEAEAPYKGAYLGPEADGKGRYRLNLAGEIIEVSLPWRGTFMAENCIAAAAAAHRLGLAPAVIAEGFSQAAPTKGRFQRYEADDLIIVDDTYNANLLSMTQALESAVEMADGAPVTAVLGEMLELGDESVMLHEELGRNIARLGVGTVFWRGGFGRAVHDGLEAGGHTGEFVEVEHTEEFLEQMRQSEIARGVILFKGSRGLRMEEFCDALREELQV